MTRVVKSLANNPFVRSILVLVTGTGFAQLIPIAFMPLVTRLYGPEDFGVWALYTSLLAIFSVASTGRYELAVMLPRKDEDAASLVIISVGIAFFLSTVLGFVIFLFHDGIKNLLSNKDIGYLLYLLPISVFLSGCYQSFSYWNNRRKKFKRLAFGRVAQSSVTLLSQLGFQKLISTGGLVIGTLMGACTIVLIFFRHICHEDKKAFLEVNKKIIISNIKRYANFPKYSVCGGLLDSAAVQAPVFILNKFFDTTITGFFSLTMRCLLMPASLVSGAVSQVLFQKIVEISHDKPKELFQYIVKVFLGLFLLSLPAVLLFTLFGEDIFLFVFGEKWSQAGVLAETLIWVVAIRFSVSPLSSVMALESNVKLGVLWQVVYFFSLSSTLLIFRKSELSQFIFIFTIHEIILYSLYFVFILFGAKRL